MTPQQPLLLHAGAPPVPTTAKQPPSNAATSKAVTNTAKPAITTAVTTASDYDYSEPQQDYGYPSHHYEHKKECSCVGFPGQDGPPGRDGKDGYDGAPGRLEGRAGLWARWTSSWAPASAAAAAA